MLYVRYWSIPKTERYNPSSQGIHDPEENISILNKYMYILTSGTWLFLVSEVRRNEIGRYMRPCEKISRQHNCNFSSDNSLFNGQFCAL